MTPDDLRAFAGAQGARGAFVPPSPPQAPLGGAPPQRPMPAEGIPDIGAMLDRGISPHAILDMLVGPMPDQNLAAFGRGNDNAARGGMIAHISAHEAEMLKRMGGSGTINPATGLPQFDDQGAGAEGGSVAGDAGPAEGGNAGAGAIGNAADTATAGAVAAAEGYGLGNDLGPAAPGHVGFGGYGAIDAASDLVAGNISLGQAIEAALGQGIAPSGDKMGLGLSALTGATLGMSPGMMNAAAGVIGNGITGGLAAMGADRTGDGPAPNSSEATGGGVGELTQFEAPVFYLGSVPVTLTDLSSGDALLQKLGVAQGLGPSAPMQAVSAAQARHPLTPHLI